MSSGFYDEMSTALSILTDIFRSLILPDVFSAYLLKLMGIKVKAWTSDIVFFPIPCMKLLVQLQSQTFF